MVRIVSGKWRGARLAVPKGTTVRPTSDRVREALFNVISHRFLPELEDLIGLDLFAGSGALGLEALSRGVREVAFVERDKTVFSTLERNVQRAGATAEAFNITAQKFLKGTPRPFDIIFLDPPYADHSLAVLLETIATGGWLSEEGLICVEHATERGIEFPEILVVAFERVYGGTRISILLRSSGD